MSTFGPEKPRGQVVSLPPIDRPKTATSVQARSAVQTFSPAAPGVTPQKPTMPPPAVGKQTPRARQISAQQGAVETVIIKTGPVKEAVQGFLNGKNQNNKKNIEELNKISVRYPDSETIVKLLSSLIADQGNRNSVYEVTVNGKMQQLKNSELIQKLIEKFGIGAKDQPSAMSSLLNYPPARGGMTVFAQACALGETDIVKKIWNLNGKQDDERKFIIVGGAANMGDQMHLQNMPLYNAIESGSLDTVKFLLTQKGPMDKDIRGQGVASHDTCLHRAFECALQSGSTESNAMKIAEAVVEKVVAPTGLVSDKKDDQRFLLDYAHAAAMNAMKMNEHDPAQLLVARGLTAKVEHVAREARIVLSHEEVVPRSGGLGVR